MSGNRVRQSRESVDPTAWTTRKVQVIRGDHTWRGRGLDNADAMDAR